jgi:PleD family two-component response regulator
MVRNADIALYQAKNGGGSAIRRYSGGSISENISK